MTLPTDAIRDILFAFPETDGQGRHALAAEKQLQALLDRITELEGDVAGMKVALRIANIALGDKP